MWLYKQCIQETHKGCESLLDQKVVQQNSEMLMLKAKLDTLKKQFEQLSVIHSKCRSHQEKSSISSQTLTDDEVNIFAYVSLYVTGFEKSHVSSTIIIRNTDFNYLKYCNSVRKTNRCLHELCHNSIAIYSLTTSTRTGWIGNHEVAGKGYINTENSQMVSVGAIYTFTYHTKQLNPWPN